MKKLLTLGFILLVLSLSFSCTKAAGKAPLKFSTTDLSGNSLTEEIFIKKDVTVLNIWRTTCGPCIGELPELAQWSASMPENVQLIGLVSDLNDSTDAERIKHVRTVLGSSGITFTNLVANEDFDSLMSSIQFVPTTLIIDSKGNIIGDPIVGAQVQLYKDSVSSYLSQKK